jgi:hypothetical protein
MHTVVIKRAIYDRDPWVALNLYTALCRAKDYCYHHLTETGSPKASFAWLQPMIEEEKKIIGEDWYPYGIEQNRPTIEALLQYTHEHGLTDRRVKLEELFAPSTRATFRSARGSWCRSPWGGRPGARRGWAGSGQAEVSVVALWIPGSHAARAPRNDGGENCCLQIRPADSQRRRADPGRAVDQKLDGQHQELSVGRHELAGRARRATTSG